MLLLGVAIWIVQPVLPSWAVLGAWGLLLLATGFMLRPFDSHSHAHAAAPRTWLKQALGVVALILGAMQIVGAASGGNDPLQPLSHWARGTVRRVCAAMPVRAFRACAASPSSTGCCSRRAGR